MIRHPRGLALFAVIAASAIALTGCSGSAEPTPTQAVTGEVNPDATLTVGLVAEPDNLDIRHTSGAALEQILIDNIYEGLVTRTPDNSIVPRLADDYEVSEDGLVYTFTLRDELSFHSGAALTSADVLASFQAVKDDETIKGHSDFSSVASIAAPDATTVTITLSEPDQNFLFALTGRAGLVFAKGDKTDMKTAENGSGPFTLSSWNKGAAITFDRAEEYWGEPAGVAEIVFEYIPDPTAGVNAAIDGTLDVLTRVEPELASQIEQTGEFTLVQGRTTDKGTLAFNNVRAPLDDKRVREALRLAVDHEGLIEALGTETVSFGTTLYGPIPALDPGYEDLSAVAPHDPKRAQELLTEAGAENLSLTLTIPNFYSTTIPQMLVSDYAKVGVELKVRAVEFSTWLDTVYSKHDYDLSFVVHVEPRDFSNFTDPTYYFGYDNPKVQELYQQSRSEPDVTKSEALLAEAARLVSEDHAADWLYDWMITSAVRPEVSGFPTGSINARLDLRGVTVSE
ncbi:ABC transporter substrate-binding protein [Microbacterium sp. YY-01]|uniref:ABC transporter substrate-binding protein n=1 Tax=Microbacterium sp. YY-01 TaxID=3421634 RepID=UPI003D182395